MVFAEGDTSMNTAVMMDGISATSPRVKARIAGLLYLLILTGIFAQGFVSGTLVVDGDAAATATNILAHRGLFIAPMFILGGADYLGVFGAVRLQALALLFLKTDTTGGAARRAKPLSSYVRRHRDGGGAE
jgi:hypothetical protein